MKLRVKKKRNRNNGNEVKGDECLTDPEGKGNMRGKNERRRE